MSTQIRAIRGMHDILPDRMAVWQYVEAVLRDVVSAYGYREIRLPIVEKTELFSRSIGEITDIVEKEMYSFEDRNGDGLTLRPEGTAGCVRAGIEHGLLHNQTPRVWYLGPMFRHERPQKGRYRQFHQIGVEAFGLPGPDVDVEIILLTNQIWRRLGLEGRFELQLNSLGTPQERAQHRAKLVDYLLQHESQLDEESSRRVHTNPLRIFDSKNPKLEKIVKNSPRLWDYLGAESRQHFEAVTALLEAAGVAYVRNPRLVRGLDYYTKTVFEWVSHELGAQGTVCAGGRYDGLVEQLGGRGTPAIGFAIGLERLVLLLEQREQLLQPDLHVYLVLVGEEAARRGLLLAEELRQQLPGLRLLTHCGGGSFKSQFRRADRSGARFAAILGEEELRRNVISIKPLRETGEQDMIPMERAVTYLAQAIEQVNS